MSVGDGESARTSSPRLATQEPRALPIAFPRLAANGEADAGPEVACCERRAGYTRPGGRNGSQSEP